MTDVNQTLQGVDTPTVDSLKPKAKTRIACWNVRTLYQTGKLAQVVREFHNYSFDILWMFGIWRLVGQDRGTENISIRTYHTIFGQIGWPSHRGSAIDYEQENGENTHRMETIRVETAQGQVQLKVHQVHR